MWEIHCLDYVISQFSHNKDSDLNLVFHFTIVQNSTYVYNPLKPRL